jgi:antitoxin component YwqK of YwqJK toxin-antitoxin module
MKKITLLIIALITVTSLQAQDLEKTNGLYYKKGMLYSGLHTEYYPTGQILMELNVLNGQEHGAAQFYHENGKLKEYREYNQGKKTGTWVTYDDDGNKIAEAGYVDGIKHGPWFIWNSDGKLLYEMNYTAGRKTGTWKQWDDAGTLIMEKTFD